MGVGNLVVRYPRRGTRFFSGEFTGANGSVSGMLSKGEVTVSRSGEGVYVLTAADGRGARLTRFSINVINPNTADGGSGRTDLTTDAMVASGAITITTFNQANAAADIIAVAKFEIETERESA